jgi:hypothetical protein
MATTPPGWYDDGRGDLRWWDGSQWTEHVQTPDAEPEGAPDADLSTQPDEAMDALLAPAIAPAPTLESAAMTDAGAPAPAESPDVVADGGYTQSAPPGYPGGFPGGPAPSGGFIAATERKKSKLWILWVVLGVILLGFVILAAVLIPVLFGMFGSTSSSGGSSAEDEAAAVAAVELYDEAWATADCAKFEQATTVEFREVIELSECGAFTAASQGFTDSVDDYVLEVTSVESTEDRITVGTTETFTSLIDDQGNPTEEPVAYEERYSYVVVPSEGGWAINEANDADAG